MQILGEIAVLDGWCKPWNEAEFIAALTEGGDSRLRIDAATGTNKYFVPPTPIAGGGGVCFSSCTASPISEAGYRQAMRCYVDLATARTRDDAAEREAVWRAKITTKLDSYLQLRGLADILLMPSGTDGLLLCSILLSLEADRAPMTAILPAASETGAGVPRAAVRQAFDGPISTGRLLGAVEIPLRNPDGRVRSEDAVSEDFALAARICAGRPIVYVTYGSKTGLVAPLAVPPGVEVVVDACQLRLSPRVIGKCLGKGWPVVVTGSKYMGGPPFSGAVLLPCARFAGLREQALAEWSHIVSASGARRESAGPLLRWVAALAQVDPSTEDRYGLSCSYRRTMAISALMRVPRMAGITGGASQAMIEAAGAVPEIISFSVSDPRDPKVLLTATQLQAIHRALAGRGVLLGQPVDVGPFGVLRLAFGLRDQANEHLATDLDRVVAVLDDVLKDPDRLAAGARCQQSPTAAEGLIELADV